MYFNFQKKVCLFADINNCCFLKVLYIEHKNNNFYNSIQINELFYNFNHDN